MLLVTLIEIDTFHDQVFLSMVGFTHFKGNRNLKTQYYVL